MIPVIYNIRSLTVRKTTTAATFLGIALVVFAFSSVLMLNNGIKRTLGRSGRPDNAIVMRNGSQAELASGVQESQIGLLASKDEVARAPAGSAFGAGGVAIGEVVVVIALPKIGTDGISNVTIRGTTPAAFEFRPEAKIIEGRLPQPGTDEVIIGKAIRGRFEGVELGQSFEIKKHRPVTVVGVFETGGSSFESEVWAGLDTVRSAYNRAGSVSSVRVRLVAPDKFEAFKLSVEADKNLGLGVEREDAYYNKQSEGLPQLITVMGILIAVFCGLGAMIGASITMYAAVAHRSREIGTLRALGFSRFSILTSFLFEAVLLAVGGGVVGVLLSLLMSMVKFSMINT